MIEKLFSYPAKWWQFWNPYSGLIGGFISGSIFSLIFLILYCLFK